MGISMFLSGGFSAAARDHPEKHAQFGAAGAAFTFIFSAGFGATWLTIPWLYPAEIFPLQVRAKGNAWGVVGWCVGNGWTVSTRVSSSLRKQYANPIGKVLLLPTMFKNIAEKTFYVFGAVNFLTIPVVWAFYPESNQRTLEEMDLLFATDSWWNWEAEKTFAMLREQNPELVQAAQRGQSVVDPETGMKLDSDHGLVVHSEGLTESNEKTTV